MITKNITVQSLWSSDMYPEFDVRMTIRMSVPGDPDADITTGLLFKPEFPDHQQEILHRRLYDGVYEGLADVALPLPSAHLVVDIVELQIVPALDTLESAEHLQHLGDILGGLTREIVANLWRGIAPSAATESPSGDLRAGSLSCIHTQEQYP